MPIFVIKFNIFDHMRVSSDNKICAMYQKDLTPVFLIGSVVQYIFRTPVRTYYGKISYLLSKVQICDHCVLVQSFNAVRHAFWNRDTIGSIGVVEDCDLDIINSHHSYIFGIFFIIIYPKSYDLGMGGVPVVKRIDDPACSLIKSMIGRMAYNIKARIDQFVSDLKGRIKGRISADFQLFSADYDFLINKGKICATYNAGCICKKR